MPVYSVSFSPDGSRLASGYKDDAVCIWEVSSARSLSTLTGHMKSVSMLCFFPNRCLLASASSTLQFVYGIFLQGNVSSHLQTAVPHYQKSYRLVFSFDQSQLASGYSDGSVRLWDLNDGSLKNVHAGFEPANTVLILLLDLDWRVDIVREISWFL
jgi:WD40 repeat protein